MRKIIAIVLMTVFMVLSAAPALSLFAGASPALPMSERVSSASLYAGASLARSLFTGASPTRASSASLYERVSFASLLAGASPTRASSASLSSAQAILAPPSNQVRVVVDGQPVSFPDAPAYIDANGRAQVPARFIGEALGASVSWDPATNKVSFTRAASGSNSFTAVEFTIGGMEYSIRVGETGLPRSRAMDTQAAIEFERVYIPARYVAEALGATVSWDSLTGTLTIASAPSPADDKVRYDHRGLLKAEYAYVYYQQWLDSLRVIYEGDRVYISYTIPAGQPQNAEFDMTITTYENEKARGKYWSYYTHEIRPGDRLAGKPYLLPNPPGGGPVKKELEYIPLDGFNYIHISFSMGAPPGALAGSFKAYAQTSCYLFLYPGRPEHNRLEFCATNPNNEREITEGYLTVSHIPLDSVIIRK